MTYSKQRILFLVRDEGVAGSNPAAPTIFLKNLAGQMFGRRSAANRDQRCMIRRPATTMLAANAILARSPKTNG